MRAKIIVTKVLIGLALIIGILLLFSGIKGTIELKIISKDYETTEGYFFDYEVYSKGGYDAIKRRHTNDTYRLFYTYQVNGRDYTVSTDMGFGIIPDYGSVKVVKYNPHNPYEALISGPNSHSFKIFFGMFFITVPSFFIWLLKPENKKTNKNQKKTSIDGVGTVIGLTLMFFSCGMLYFITGEFSLIGIINFYRTSFIIPMVIPILLIVAGGYLLIRSLFFNPNRADRTYKTKESNYKVRNIVGCVIVVLIFLTFTVGGKLLKGNINRFQDGNEKQTDKNVIRNADFTTVHTMLSERGFETANIATTYWFYDENKITNVVSGIKGDMAFEFYEYTDNETTDSVYNSILYDVSNALESSEREKCETMLQGGGKMFTLTENGVDSVVMYKGNIVIYAHYREGQSEIQDILEELGFIISG